MGLLLLDLDHAQSSGDSRSALIADKAYLGWILPGV